MALSNWVFELVADLFSRSKCLGYAAVGLGGLALLALAVMAGREIWSIGRQSKIAHMHMSFAAARAADDRDPARRLVTELVGLQSKRGSSAAVRANLLDLTKEIVDGRDLIDIAERDLVLPLDREVSREIADGRETRFDGDGDFAARACRCCLCRRAGVAAGSSNFGNLWRASRLLRVSQAHALGRRASRDHRRRCRSAIR